MGGLMPNLCRSCRAPIRWVLSSSGKAMPLDLDPVPEGTIALSDRGGVVVGVIVPERARAGYAGSLYRSHFATCPNAGKHRR